MANIPTHMPFGLTAAMVASTIIDGAELNERVQTLVQSAYVSSEKCDCISAAWPPQNARESSNAALFFCASACAKD
jgi:hypothetical protein